MQTWENFMYWQSVSCTYFVWGIMITYDFSFLQHGVISIAAIFKVMLTAVPKINKMPHTDNWHLWSHGTLYTICL
jgi:hypothetical protein